jgi:hypothetical protein
MLACATYTLICGRPPHRLSNAYGVVQQSTTTFQDDIKGLGVLDLLRWCVLQYS